uniref:Uncharacterized protein n=1 Tax=Rhizophora mucronata TaxID=61149 RepID=A0A2P2MFL8_RHIMU
MAQPEHEWNMQQETSKTQIINKIQESKNQKIYNKAEHHEKGSQCLRSSWIVNYSK